MAFSRDDGQSWTDPVETPAWYASNAINAMAREHLISIGMHARLCRLDTKQSSFGAAWSGDRAVWPQLLVTQNGVGMLSSGRPGVGAHTEKLNLALRRLHHQIWSIYPSGVDELRRTATQTKSTTLSFRTVVDRGHPGLWTFPSSKPLETSRWRYHNVLAAHNSLATDPALRFDPIVERIVNVSSAGYNGSATMGPETTSYTR
jgi:hypothetical protein